MASVRGHILDLATNESQIFAQNPEEFEEVYSAAWEDRAALAATHHRRQFRATANPTVTMELVYNRKIIADLARQLGSYDEATVRRVITKAKAFLMSLTAPRRHRGSVLVQAPPPVMLVWPKTLRIRATVDTCTIRNSEFASDASLVEFRASLEITEQRTKELFSSDLRRLGSLRGAGNG